MGNQSVTMLVINELHKHHSDKIVNENLLCYAANQSSKTQEQE